MLKKIENPCGKCESKVACDAGMFDTRVCMDWIVYESNLKVQQETAWAIVDWLIELDQRYPNNRPMIPWIVGELEKYLLSEGIEKPVDTNKKPCTCCDSGNCHAAE